MKIHHQHHPLFFIFYLLSIVLSLDACQSQKKADQSTRIFVASSMSKPLDQYLKAQGLSYQLSSAGSQELSMMIDQGGESPSLFISAHPKDFKALIAQGRMRGVKSWVCNRLSIVGHTQLLSDQGLQQVSTIGIAHENVPLGQYTKQIIDQMPKAWQKAFQARLKIKALNALQLVQYLKNKEIEAAIIYQTDALALIDMPQTIIPPELNIYTSYHLVYASDEGEALAQKLIDDQQKFLALGFVKCP